MCLFVVPSHYAESWGLHVWIYGGVLCHDNLTAESMDSWRVSLRILHHTLGFFLPLAVMMFCYSFTMCTLCRTRNSQKQKAMQVILSVVLAFIVCWLPNNILELIDTVMRGSQVMETCELRDSIDVALYVTQAMAFIHCAINPILYAFIQKKFCNQLLTSLLRKACWGETQCRNIEWDLFIAPEALGKCSSVHLFLLNQGLWSLKDHTSEFLDLAQQTLYPSVVFVFTATVFTAMALLGPLTLRLHHHLLSVQLF